MDKNCYRTLGLIYNYDIRKYDRQIDIRTKVY